MKKIVVFIIIFFSVIAIVSGILEVLFSFCMATTWFFYSTLSFTTILIFMFSKEIKLLFVSKK